MGQVADAFGVAKSLRALELLAAATPDAEALQALVAEMREADAEFTKNLLLAVFAACSSVGEVGLVAELVETYMSRVPILTSVLRFSECML